MIHPSLAVVFPGQGSQQVGMLSALAQQLPLINNVFNRASQVLGFDLWQLVQEGPDERLNLTENAQPALLAAAVSLWLSWCDSNKARPAYLAGHSLGEWSALVAAGVLSFEDAVQLVRLRGQFMQEAVPVGQGSMAVILDLAEADVVSACEKASEVGAVSPANFNSPSQLVIAGEVKAVDLAMSLCKEAGAKRALKLAVSAPFHTALMAPAAQKLQSFIESTPFNAPQIPIIHNCTAAAETDPQKIKALMVQQIYSPVLWTDSVRQLVQRGVGTTLEIGPGKVLSGLIKRIDPNVMTLNTADTAAWSQSLEHLQ